MSRTVDERVVSMQFDNKQFESNVATTMSTLEKLKQKLNLPGASKGLEDVNNAARKCDMTPLGNAVESVRTRFSALEVMGVTALANITNSAVNAGKRMASALTIDPIKTGLSEYETQINAVQTILANTESKGTTLGQVNSALDELNTYADKTIYNFTEMTRNIGTFTAAGVDLDTSVNAIQGIANLAAVSGSTSQQASTAMYQLSQALASGTVKLMDWNSVVNAGMGGQVFQDALKETARVHGVAIDDLIEKEGSFRETLSSGWLTSEILTDTLSHFTMAAEEGSEAWDSYKKSLQDQGYSEKQAEAILKLSNTATDAATKVKTATQLWDTLKETAQSGWTQTWEILLGDFGESKDLFSGIYETLSPILEASAKARNELLSGGLSSGWKQLMSQGIADEEGYRDTIKAVAKDHGIAIDEMIEKEGSFDAALKAGLKDGSITSDMLSESVTKLADKMRGMSDEEMKAAGYTKEHIEQIEALEAGLKNGSISMDEFAEKITKASGRENIIQSLYNAFEGLMSVVTPIKEAFHEIIPPITAEQLYGFTEGLRDFTEKLTLSETASNNLKRTFKGVFAVVNIVRKAFGAVFKAIKPLFGGLDDFGGGILETTAKLGDWLVGLDETITKSGAFEKAVDWIHKAFSKVRDILKPVSDGVKEFGTIIGETFADISDKAANRLGPLSVIGNAIKTLFIGLGKVLQTIAPWFSSLASTAGGLFADLMDGISNAIQGADFSKLFDFVNGGIFAAIGVGIAKFVKNIGDTVGNASGFLENINGILEGVGDSFEAFTQQLKAKTLLTIASAIAILAVALIALSLVDSEKLTISLAAISGLLIELMVAMDIFSSIASGMDLKSMLGMSAIGKAMTSLAKSLLILAVAMKILSSLSWDEVARGLVVTVVGLGALVGAVNLLPEKKVANAAKAITKLSIGLVIFAAAMKIMASMSWEEIAKGLVGTVVGLAALVAAVNLLPKGLKVQAVAIIALSMAMVILGAALKIMATMSWNELARGLVALAGSLAAITIATKLMPKSLPLIGAGLLLVASALVVIGGAFKIMATMSWDEIARGMVALGGSLLIIAIGVNAMKGALLGAAAMLIVAGAIAVFTPALMTLGSMSLGEIGKGLLALAGVFVVVGLAGLILGPIVPTIIALSVAITLLGVGCFAVGTAIVLFATGIGLLATALAAGGSAIVLFVSSLIGLIPYLIEQIGIGIIKFCEVIAGSASAICEAVTVIVEAVVQALVNCVPTIVEGIFVLVDQLLDALVTYGPTIVGKLFEFLIGLLESLAEKLPDLIQAGVDVLMAFFSGVLEALQSIDPSALVNGILAVGALTALVVAMAGIAVLTPAAMIGVVGAGAVIAELAIVLAAIGALAQIPGLQWLIGEGGDLLESIGTAIGQFIGGLIGGIAQGMTSSLPDIGTDLSNFMTNIQPFIEGVKAIDPSMMDGVTTLVGAILALTGANLLESLTSWLTGGSSLSSFGEEIAAFGPYFKAYADSIAGIDTSAVEASATAASALSTLASSLPNSGGLVGLLAGENDLGTFAEQLVPFGEGLKGFADSVTGIDTAAVIASAEAAKAIAEMTSCIPNEGGMASWFTGENSVSKFGSELIMLGIGLKGYAIAIAGIDTAAIIASVSATQALADMVSTIPNEGGLVAWFTGENSVSRFGEDLIALGNGLRGFAIATADIVPESIVSAAGAAKALADMTTYVPNEGGMLAWFTGENSLANFAAQLPLLGIGLKGFSDSIEGIVPENVTAAANAAKALAEMANVVPNEGGLVAWFKGDNSISAFGDQLPALGEGLKGFSDSVTGIIPENITAAVAAAKNIATLSSCVPAEGGIVAWFTGEASLSKFGEDMIALGKGLKGFSDSTAGIIPENIISAANAAKALAEMANTIPTSGGIFSWFTGDNNMENFGIQLKAFGASLKGYSDAVIGINVEAITMSVTAGTGLAALANAIPITGGLWSVFSGDNNMSTFGSQLTSFGASLVAYSTSVVGIDTEAIGQSVTAAKKLTSLANAVPESGLFVSDDLANFAKDIKPFGTAIKEYSSAVVGIDLGAITTSVTAAKKLINLIKNTAEVDSGNAKEFKKALEHLGESSVDDFVDAFDDSVSDLEDIGGKMMKAVADGAKDKASKVADAAKDAAEDAAEKAESKDSKFKSAGKKLVEAFADGIEAKSSTAKSAVKSVASDAADGADDKKSSFTSAGKDMVSGFASGITINTFKAEAAARTMAQAALDAAKEKLKINSPSKVFMAMAASIPEGFAMGIDKLQGVVVNSASDMATTAITSVKRSISDLGNIINSDIDTQPTIRPVLDLSDVKSNAGAISNLLGLNPSVGVLANVGSISSMMNSQNGVNDDVVAAINKLSKGLDNVGNTTYSINGITYDDGSNIADAMRTITRAAKMGRRV